MLSNTQKREFWTLQKWFISKLSKSTVSFGGKIRHCLKCFLFIALSRDRWTTKGGHIYQPGKHRGATGNPTSSTYATGLSFECNEITIIYQINNRLVWMSRCTLTGSVTHHPYPYPYTIDTWKRHCLLKKDNRNRNQDGWVRSIPYMY